MAAPPRQPGRLRRLRVGGWETMGPCRSISKNGTGVTGSRGGREPVRQVPVPPSVAETDRNDPDVPYPERATTGVATAPCPGPAFERTGPPADVPGRPARISAHRGMAFEVTSMHPHGALPPFSSADQPRAASLRARVRRLTGLPGDFNIAPHHTEKVASSGACTGRGIPRQIRHARLPVRYGSG
jgi:hypothetical protein